MMSQFREPPDFEWYGVLWFGSTIYLIWEAGWFVNKKLNKQFPWEKGTIKRLALQVLSTTLFGVLLYLSTYVILNSYENFILGSNNPLSIFHLMVATATGFLIVQVINSIQIGYLLLDNWQKAQLKAEQQNKEQAIKQLNGIRKKIDRQFLPAKMHEIEEMVSTSPIQAMAILHEFSETYSNNINSLEHQLAEVENGLKQEPPLSIQELKNTVPQTLSNYKTRFLVKSGPKLMVVQTDQIAGFYKDDLVLLITKSGKKYVVDHTLEDLISMLDPERFFRINRQCIVSIDSIQEIRPEGSQLAMSMSVDFPRLLFVSQRITADCKRWLNED